jgi:hypothetical protein
MAQTVWKLPVPSTALLSGAAFHQLLGRTCALAGEYEDDDDNVVSLKMLFEGVEAFKCTHDTAVTVEMIETAYDQVADLGSTEWLTQIESQLVDSREDATGLRHLMIYFDDGPCYEFICRSFRAEENIDRKISL